MKKQNINKLDQPITNGEAIRESDEALAEFLVSIGNRCSLEFGCVDCGLSNCDSCTDTSLIIKWLSQPKAEE